MNDDLPMITIKPGAGPWYAETSCYGRRPMLPTSKVRSFGGEHQYWQPKDWDLSLDDLIQVGPFLQALAENDLVVLYADDATTDPWKAELAGVWTTAHFTSDSPDMTFRLELQRKIANWREDYPLHELYEHQRYDQDGMSVMEPSSVAQKQRSDYLYLRSKFEPASPTLVIVAESPPVSGKYFYDPDGRSSEPLFAALMKLIGIAPRTKLEGLIEFQKRGWTLVDATYEPVNAHTGRDRDRVIDRGYPELRDDLRQLLAAHWSSVPVVLIKANVCRLVEPKLKADGFNVLNNSRSLPFPSHGWSREFDRLFREIAPQ